MMGTYFPDLPARTLSQMGDVKDNPVHLVAEEIYAKWPVAFLWGRSSGTSGEHPKGLALDFSVLAYGGGVDNPGPANKAMGDAIAAYLWANRVRLGVWYVIWNRRWISRNPQSDAYNKWIPYTGKSPHTDHVHVSFYSDPVYKPPTTPQPEPVPTIPPEDTMAGILPAQLVQVAGTRAVYAVGFTGAVHVKNPTHLRFLREQGWVTEDIKTIPAADLAELLEKE